MLLEPPQLKHLIYKNFLAYSSFYFTSFKLIHFIPNIRIKIITIPNITHSAIFIPVFGNCVFAVSLLIKFLLPLIWLSLFWLIIFCSRIEEFSSPDIPINNKHVRKIKRNFKDVQFVRCASGDKFIADEVFKNKLINEYGCDICDMESAGIALTCYKNNVDLVSIKAVSDSGSGGEYEDNVIGASEAIFKFANKVLELL